MPTAYGTYTDDTLPIVIDFIWRRLSNNIKIEVAGVSCRTTHSIIIISANKVVQLNSTTCLRKTTHFASQ